MANRLTREGRAFKMPISPNDDGILPNFALTDTPRPVEIKVYGLNGLAEYEKRTREKQAIRAKKGVQCVEWKTEREPLDAVSPPSPRAAIAPITPEFSDDSRSQAIDRADAEGGARQLGSPPIS